jgi:hypothetical protein
MAEEKKDFFFKNNPKKMSIFFKILTLLSLFISDVKKYWKDIHTEEVGRKYYVIHRTCSPSYDYMLDRHKDYESVHRYMDDYKSMTKSSDVVCFLFWVFCIPEFSKIEFYQYREIKSLALDLVYQPQSPNEYRRVKEREISIRCMHILSIDIKIIFKINKFYFRESSRKKETYLDWMCLILRTLYDVFKESKSYEKEVLFHILEYADMKLMRTLKEAVESSLKEYPSQRKNIINIKNEFIFWVLESPFYTQYYNIILNI